MIKVVIYFFALLTVNCINEYVYETPADIRWIVYLLAKILMTLLASFFTDSLAAPIKSV